MAQSLVLLLALCLLLQGAFCGNQNNQGGNNNNQGGSGSSSWLSKVSYIEARDQAEYTFSQPCDGYFITNAKITTFDSARPTASRMRTLGSTIAWVGNSLSEYQNVVKNPIAPCAIINARRARVGPGIWDSHVHLIRASIEAGCQIYDAELAFTKNAFLNAIKSGKNKYCTSTEWIAVTGGFNKGSIGGAFPTIAELDNAVPNQPFVGAQRYVVPDAETLIFAGPGFVNTRARNLLNAAGFNIDPSGSVPDGIEMNAILAYLRNRMSLDEQITSTKRLFDYLRRKGVIGGTDMAGANFDPVNGYNAVWELHRRQELDFVIGLGLRPPAFPGGIEACVNFTGAEVGSVLGVRDSLWNAGLGEGLFPSSAAGNEATITYYLKTIRESRQGNVWRAFVNIEYPANVTGTMAALQNVKNSHGIPPYTWSLEHAYGLKTHHLQWLDDNKMFLSVDGSRFLTGQDSEDFRGPTLRTAMSLTNDPLIAVNTDGRNAAPINWWITAQFIADGKNATGYPINADETIPITKIYEYGSKGTARKVGQLDIRGTITAGKLADFVIWKQDPLSVATSKIRETEAKATFIRGRKVFSQ